MNCVRGKGERFEGELNIKPHKSHKFHTWLECEVVGT